jgi:hypothetical protein
MDSGFIAARCPGMTGVVESEGVAALKGKPVRPSFRGDAEHRARNPSHRSTGRAMDSGFIAARCPGMTENISGGTVVFGGASGPARSH